MNLIFGEFDGEYFVCYIDISGFKTLMKQGYELARDALLFFYESGYQIIRKIYGVEGIFISDCAILASIRSDDHLNELKKLMRVIKEINIQMLEKNYLVTSSIAFGKFYFKDLNSFSGVQKLPVYGEGYLNAFLDNENQLPRLEPGLCRIVKYNLPQIIIDTFKSENFRKIDDLGIAEETKDHFYFYWMLKNNQVSEIKNSYKNAKEYPFIAIKRILKSYIE